MINRVARVIFLAIILITIIVFVVTCSLSRKAFHYTNIGEEVNGLVADFVGFDRAKIIKIDKIIYQKYVRDSDMYIFAEIDLPEIWESSRAIVSVGGRNLINPADDFMYDAQVRYEGNRREIMLYRLYEDNKVAMFVNEGSANNLWLQIKDYLN